MEVDMPIRKATFEPLKRQFIRLYKAKLLTEPYDKSGGLKEDLRKKCYDTISTTKINGLRNKIIHSSAYRPTREEVAKYNELVLDITWLRAYFSIQDSVLVLNRPLRYR